jgi:hypothetical protein
MLQKESQGMKHAITCAMILVLVGGSALAQEKADLHLRFAKGDVHHLHVTMEQTIEQTVRDVAHETKQTIVVDYSLTVEDVNEQGIAGISLRYDAVALHAPKTAGGPVEYDSASPPGQVPQAASALAALVGQGFSFSITSAGKVTQVTGAQKMLETVLSHLSIPEGAARMAAEKVLRQQLDDADLRQNLQNLFGPFPDHPVAIGDSWTRMTEMNIGFPMTVQSTYALQGREDGIAIVEVTGSIATAPDPSMALNTLKMNYSLKGEQSGTIRIDEATGWLKAAEVSQHLNGSATVRGPNIDAQTVPVTIDSKMKVEEK